MAEQQIELTLPRSEAWVRPKGRHACGRDPEAGPGTCWHWWDGCPKAEKRGCYILHARKLREQKKGAPDA